MRPIRATVILVFVALFPCLPMGCGEDDDKIDSDSTTQADTIDETTDGAGADATVEVPGDTPPVLSGVVLAENPLCTLSAVVVCQTDQLSTMRMTIAEDGGPTREVIFAVGGKSHELPVLGLHAMTSYTVTVTAFNLAGLSTTSEPLAYTTGPLPDDMPPVEIVTLDKDKMSPGITMYSTRTWITFLTSGSGYLVALDDDGEIIWYHSHEEILETFHPTWAGTIVYLHGDSGATEVDMLGNVVGDWPAEALGYETFHHDIMELPSGTLLTIASELRVIDGYTDNQGNPTSYNVVGEILVELDRSGEVVWEWHAFDHLDPHRKGTDFDLQFWDLVYTDVQGGTKDWLHGNSLDYDEASDTLVFSMRNQDWLAKIDHGSGDLLWLMGNDGDLTLQGEGDWMYHAHSPYLTDDGTIMIFDNGNTRPSTPEGEVPYSRAVEYLVDEAAMTATQVWEYAGEEPFYSYYVGDTDPLDNGNVLIADGGRLTEPLMSVVLPTNKKWARIIEVTKDDPAEVVFEMVSKDLDTEDNQGFAIFRAKRLPSIYPAALATETLVEE